ncbi:MAG: family 10 glycosylhydrolase [Chloroflexi bacterium]|nr:family 10 glycosylhydrolase [Chloroflexota bacterium]MBU1746077.1 family 10 glycosylhydrolase [Chloroflexota bacterium]
MTESEMATPEQTTPAPGPGRRVPRWLILALVAILVIAGAIGGGAYWVYTQPKLTAGTVRDAETDQPMPGAAVHIGAQQATTDAAGRYQINGSRPADVVEAEYAGYFPAEAPAATAPADAGQWLDALLAEVQALQNGRAIDLTLRPAQVQGTARDARTQEPLAGVRVWTDDAEVKSDAAGAFTLLRLVKGTAIQARQPGYADAQLTYEGGETLDIALTPNAVAVTVRDAYTGQPVPGVAVSAGEVQDQTDAAGQCTLYAITADIQVQLKGYDAVTVPLTAQTAIAVELRPNVVAGVVRAAKDGQPVAGAWVGTGTVEATTTDDGSYRLEGVPPDATLMVRAKGYDGANVPITRTSVVNVDLDPFVVRGVYLPFGFAGRNTRTLALWDLVETTEINAIVVDVKSDNGQLNYRSDVPLAISATVTYSSLDYVITEAKKRDLYVIARVVVFKDNLLAKQKPEWRVMLKSGQPYLDYIDSMWVDPFRPEVWDYNIALCKEIVAMGVDEIQFDYVRFPSDGPVLSQCVYSNPENSEATRSQAVNGFLERAYAELKPLGVYISADVFGLTGYATNDMGIGQHVDEMSKHLDYLCPMVYPSTFAAHTGDIAVPPAQPYGIVHWSLGYFQKKLKDVPNVTLLPWLQAFQDYAFKVEYTVEEMRAQRRASEDRGIRGWLYWNAACKYLPELFGPDPAKSP